MTTTLQIIAAFLAGTAVSNIFFWIIHTKQKRAWQAEYRRLMGGIDRARLVLDNGPYHRLADKILLDTYRGL